MSLDHRFGARSNNVAMPAPDRQMIFTAKGLARTPEPAQELRTVERSAMGAADERRLASDWQVEAPEARRLTVVNDDVIYGGHRMQLLNRTNSRSGRKLALSEGAGR